MDELIKISIDARKQGIFTTYDVKRPENLEKIEDLFKRIEALGMDCKTQGEFEEKFSSSELAGEYSNLFIDLNKTEKNKYYDPSGEEDDTEEYIKEEVKDEAKFQAKQLIGGAFYGKVSDLLGTNFAAREAFDLADDLAHDLAHDKYDQYKEKKEKEKEEEDF